MLEKVPNQSAMQARHATKPKDLNQGHMTYEAKDQNELKNSPKSCKSKPQKPLRWHLNDLILEAYTMAQTWSKKHQPFKA